MLKWHQPIENAARIVEGGKKCFQNSEKKKCGEADGWMRQKDLEGRNLSPLSQSRVNLKTHAVGSVMVHVIRHRLRADVSLSK